MRATRGSFGAPSATIPSSRRSAPIMVTRLPANALALPMRKQLSQLQQQIEQSTPTLAHLYEELAEHYSKVYPKFQDKTLVEANSDLVLELAASAWPHLSAAAHSVLVDVGSGTGRFAATCVAAGMFAKAHAVESNVEVSRLVASAYKDEAVAENIRSALVFHQHKLGEPTKKAGGNQGVDALVLGEADAIFVNNFDFEPLNVQQIANSIERYAKRNAVLVCHKPFPPISRISHSIHYESVFDGVMSFPPDKPARYFVHYLDSYPLLVPPTALPLVLKPLGKASNASVEQYMRDGDDDDDVGAEDAGATATVATEVRPTNGDRAHSKPTTPMTSPRSVTTTPHSRKSTPAPAKGKRSKKRTFDVAESPASAIATTTTTVHDETSASVTPTAESVSMLEDPVPAVSVTVAATRALVSETVAECFASLEDPVAPMPAPAVQPSVVSLEDPDATALADTKHEQSQAKRTRRKVVVDDDEADANPLVVLPPPPPLPQPPVIEEEVDPFADPI